MYGYNRLGDSSVFLAWDYISDNTYHESRLGLKYGYTGGYSNGQASGTTQSEILRVGYLFSVIQRISKYLSGRSLF
jgi:hypothetical protein